jgi:hypothetical protein
VRILLAAGDGNQHTERFRILPGNAMSKNGFFTGCILMSHYRPKLKTCIEGGPCPICWLRRT